MRDEKADGKKDNNKEEDRQKGQGTPPRTRDYPLGSPYYEEQFDPFFTEETQPIKDEGQDHPVEPEEDWYWREPDNYWLEEGMWPWPEPPPRRKEEPGPPNDGAEADR